MAEAMPGLYWPIYTHLGGITVPIADHLLPSPYFDGDTLARLQDRIYNVTGSVRPFSRIWMARSSVFYDYILIRRVIAEHAKLSDTNTVEIISWLDPVLNKTLPRSMSQLYGQTFYVADPARANVLARRQAESAFSRATAPTRWAASRSRSATAKSAISSSTRSIPCRKPASKRSSRAATGISRARRRTSRRSAA